MTSLFGGGSSPQIITPPAIIDPPLIPPPAVMPLPNDSAVKRARTKSLAAQRLRSGRVSTILSDPADAGTTLG